MMSFQEPSNDGLGDRMKNYERAYRTVLPARSWTMVRLDGKAFHTWTKGLPRPYSTEMIEAMADAMLQLTKHIPVTCIYQQSDEMTLVLQDFARPDTQAWYGGQVQKIASVSASMLTSFFGRHFPDRPAAFFDARVFTVPNRVEVANALLWRQLDARRNAISMIASSMYSSQELHGKSTEQRREMIQTKGYDEEDADPRFLHGQLAFPVEQQKTSYVDRRSQQTILLPNPVISRVWEIEAAPTLDAQPSGVLLNQILPADPSPDA